MPARVQALPPPRIVLVATGGYERAVVALRAGHPASAPPPQHRAPPPLCHCDYLSYSLYQRTTGRLCIPIPRIPDNAHRRRPGVAPIAIPAQPCVPRQQRTHGGRRPRCRPPPSPPPIRPTTPAIPVPAAADVRPPIRPQPSKAVQHLRALMLERRHLAELRAATQQRRRPAPPARRPRRDAHLALQRAELRELDPELPAAPQADPNRHPRSAWLPNTPGIGPAPPTPRPAPTQPLRLPVVLTFPTNQR